MRERKGKSKSKKPYIFNVKNINSELSVFKKNTEMFKGNGGSCEEKPVEKNNVDVYTFVYLCDKERRENEYDTAKGVKCKHLGKAGDGYQAFFVLLLLQLFCKSENMSIQRKIHPLKKCTLDARSMIY